MPSLFSSPSLYKFPYLAPPQSPIFPQHQHPPPQVTQMPSILLRIFHLYNLLNTVLLYFVPKKLRSYLPTSWYPQPPKTTTTTPPPPQHSLSDIIILRRMDADELRRVFQMFDKNGDGRITKKELNESLENMGIFIPDSELTQMIEKIDVNGDGCVDIDEFGALYQSIMDEKDEEEDMREAFKVFDQNGDGFITVEELRSVLAALGLKQGRTVEDCRRMIMKVDVDGDGMVNFNEFKQMMRGGGFAALS
ncbi:Calmodulin-like protein 5 [Camellia lanceoleosa]|uniref:Calmodulin-like protein 5 n=1 Tax=Camellia lanceoleosa TaxID=1840588 RepID=A0ACC0GXD9_9ERIC|nr:Calmodulin-like protein 5 [Camellia lanceoleosa]